MTDAEHQKWLDGWQQFMVDIWRERMMQFTPPVNDTGALARSIQGVVHPGPVTTIEHHSLSTVYMWLEAWAMDISIITVATSSF